MSGEARAADREAGKGGCGDGNGGDDSSWVRRGGGRYGDGGS